MELKLSKQTMQNLADFMKAVRGSCLNAGYISCDGCSSTSCTCRDFLFAPDSTGKPIILSLSDARLIDSGIESTACLFNIPSRCFIDFYSLYIRWETDTNDVCPLLQLAIRIKR